jgi:hypothetical protein
MLMRMMEVRTRPEEQQNYVLCYNAVCCLLPLMMRNLALMIADLSVVFTVLSER